MYTLSNKTRFDGYNEIRNETGNTGSLASNKQLYKNLIAKANSVSLSIILKHYGYRIDTQNRKIICPFHFHKNGKEGTPSFQYYPDTNTFWCFGCKVGTGATDFVASKEGISIFRAAHKIIESYASEISITDSEIDSSLRYSERLEILMEFSNFIREHLQSKMYSFDDVSNVEKITFSFDKMIEYHTIDNDALRRLVFELKSRFN